MNKIRPSAPNILPQKLRRPLLRVSTALLLAAPAYAQARAVYVFDVTQTDGKDLPALTEVQGDVSGYRERLSKFVEAQGIELSYSEKIGPAKGLSHGGKITLLLGMQPAEEFSTLVHELGHLCGAEIYVASASGHA